VKAKKIQGISDIVDLTDGQTGTNVVIELKNGFEPEDVLEKALQVNSGWKMPLLLTLSRSCEASLKLSDSKNCFKSLLITASK
jgi:hypothetical protein